MWSAISTTTTFLFWPVSKTADQASPMKYILILFVFCMSARDPALESIKIGATLQNKLRPIK